jgi:hypothetical protein
LEDRPELPHAILLSNRKATPPLWKGLSTQFHNRLIFGEARAEGDSVAGAVIEKLGVTSFPTVVVYPGNSTEPVKYDGTSSEGPNSRLFILLSAVCNRGHEACCAYGLLWKVRAERLVFVILGRI